MKVFPDPSCTIKAIIKRRIIPSCAAVLIACLAPALSAQETALSIDEAIKLALEKNPNVESANWDWLSATAGARAAEWKAFPSLSLSAGYERRSKLLADLQNVYTLRSDLQYPVFAGFRMRETAAIAKLQAGNKALAFEMTKRSLIFEVRRAYGEALRAEHSVVALQKNLELARSNCKLVSDRAAMGTATRADMLAADTLRKQAEMDLGSARSMQKHACLVLTSLAGRNPGENMRADDPGSGASLPALTTKPEDMMRPGPIETTDSKKLIQLALSRRPETRASLESIRIAEHNVRLAESGLYPVLSLTGNYIYADPNPRVPGQTDPDEFVDTWSIGIQLSYNLGELPANIEERSARSYAVRKSRSDAQEQRDKVILDVQTCILNLERTRNDLGIVGDMTGQAKENLRIVRQRYNAGTANYTDLLGAEAALLQAEFAVTNKEIDLQIATADLIRAAAMEDIK